MVLDEGPAWLPADRVIGFELPGVPTVPQEARLRTIEFTNLAAK